MSKTEIQKAFTYARRHYRGGGAMSPGVAPIKAALALQTARELLAALPALKEQEAAASAALQAQRAIDSRKYNPAFMAAQESARKARAALSKGQEFTYKTRPWFKGDSGHWSERQQGLYYIENPRGLFRSIEPAENFGRFCSYGNDPEGHWYTTPYVAQLRGRNGKAVFAPAWAEEETPGGGPCAGYTIDLGPRALCVDSDKERAQFEAAAAANSEAESQAEKEFRYQSAWQAGQIYQEALDTVKTSKEKARALLRERRAARVLSPSGFPAICAALESSARALLRAIGAAKEEAATALAGDAEGAEFWTSDKDLRAAFCDGAGLQEFPL